MSEYIDNFLATMERQMAELKANDAAAVAADTLVGRYIQEGIADGYAYYVIVKANSRTVTVEHVDYCDGYRVPMIESMDCKLPIKAAVENLRRRDFMADLFAKAQ